MKISARSYSCGKRAVLVIKKQSRLPPGIQRCLSGFSPPLLGICWQHSRPSNDDAVGRSVGRRSHITCLLSTPPSPPPHPPLPSFSSEVRSSELDTAAVQMSYPGLGIELLGLVAVSERRFLRSLSVTKPISSIPKPGCITGLRDVGVGCDNFAIYKPIHHLILEVNGIIIATCPTASKMRISPTTGSFLPDRTTVG